MDVDWRPAAPRKGVLRHLVCYKFEEDTAEEDKLARVDGFAELIEAVGTVRSFEWGTNNSPVRQPPQPQPVRWFCPLAPILCSGRQAVVVTAAAAASPNQKGPRATGQSSECTK